MINDERLEDIAMRIIANAGAARANAFDALSEAKKGDFDKAQALIVSCREFSHLAQTAHRELLQMDAKGEVPATDILLTHAQDHFMMATLAEEMAAEFIELYRLIKNGQEVKPQ